MESKYAFLVGEYVYLRPLLEKDIEGSYMSWFNDEEVCQWNSHHVYPYTEDAAKEYIQMANKSNDELNLAIILLEGDKHIGNIALTKINSVNRAAHFGMILGDKTVWGKGYAKEAAKLIIEHGFFAMNLNRIYGGIMDNNLPTKIFLKILGWKKEGVRRQAAYKNGKYVDIIEYGLLKDEYVQVHYKDGNLEIT